MKKYILISDFAALKKDVFASKKNHYFQLIEEANRCLSIPNFDAPPKESTTYLSQAILNLSLAFLLSEDKKYLDEALRIIKMVCSFPYWGNAHLVNVDLSASWILFGLSLSYNFLEEYLSDEDKKMIEDKLIYQARLMRDYVDEHKESWPSHYLQNHNWINFTGLAMTGYVLKDKYPSLKEYIDLAKDNFKIVFSYLPDDGSDYEGVTYWRYGVPWLFLYADLLKDQEDVDLFKESKFLKNTFSYRLYQSASEMHKQLNFGDCHDRYSCNSCALYYKVAHEYNNGYAQKFANLIFDNYLFEEQYLSKIKPGILKEAWLNLIWYDYKIKEKDFKRLKKVKYFKDLGLITIRNSFDDDSLVFSFKCGYPGGKKQWKIGVDYYKKHKKWILSLSHHHPDNLSYILTYGKDYMAIDDGYNRNILPYNHNVLLVDNKYSDMEDKNDIYLSSINKRLEENENEDLLNYYGEVEYFYNYNEITCFKANNQRIYPLELKMKEVSRTIFTNNLEYIILINNFKSNINHFYQNVLNLDSEIKKIDSSKYLISGSLNSLNYYLFSKENLNVTTSINEVKSVMTTQEPNNFCFTKMFTFIGQNINPIKHYCNIEIFAKEKHKIVYCNDYIKINEDEFVLINNSLGFVFDGDLLYIKKHEDGPNELVLINGKYVKYNGELLIESNKRKSIRKEI